ncbi:MAG: GNAT family N-acetyltransferase [Woeseiaceae bacterium]
MKLKLLTDRLVLTPMESADVDLALELWTDPEVVRYVCDVASEAEVRQEMRGAVRRGGDGEIGEWCVTDRKTGKKIGCAYLLPVPTEEEDYDCDLIVLGQAPDSDIEVGYFLKPSVWRRGYATEICSRMLQFAFQEASLDELVASVDENNTASRNVLEKTGFFYRGRAKCWGKKGPIYKITRDEWIESRRSY